MKTVGFYIFLIILSIGCRSAADSSPLEIVMNSDNMPMSEVSKVIDKAVKNVNATKLDSTTRKEYADRVAYDYVIYTMDDVPVKVNSTLNENTYTVQSSYYLHDGLPYYIEGTMRDRDRASGNYTHQELKTYLNATKVLQRLQKTAVNQENRASDLSNITQEDITHTIYSPELDAENRYKEVLRILGNPID